MKCLRILSIFVIGAAVGCGDGLDDLPVTAGGWGKADTETASPATTRSSLRIVHEQTYDLSNSRDPFDPAVIEFELSPTTHSFMIQVVETTPTPGAFYQIVDLAPVGKNPLDLRGSKESLASLYGHELAYLYPSTDEQAIFPPTGKWRFEVKYLPEMTWLRNVYPDTGDRKIAVRVVAKESSFTQPYLRGELKVYFHFTGSNGLTAAKAKASQAFSDVLDRLEKIFAKARIDIVVGEFADLELDGAWHGAAMTRLSQHIQRKNLSDGVHVVYIDSVDRILEKVQMDRTAMHISGGLPGLLPTPDVNYGGVLISSCQGVPAMGLSLSGNHLAHEICHYLGLEHVLHNEITPDPISDTADDDFRNVMSAYARWSSATVAELTAGQAKVIAGHPLVTLFEQ